MYMFLFSFSLFILSDENILWNIIRRHKYRCLSAWMMNVYIKQKVITLKWIFRVNSHHGFWILRMFAFRFSSSWLSISFFVLFFSFSSSRNEWRWPLHSVAGMREWSIKTRSRLQIDTQRKVVMSHRHCECYITCDDGIFWFLNSFSQLVHVHIFILSICSLALVSLLVADAMLLSYFILFFIT